MNKIYRKLENIVLSKSYMRLIGLLVLLALIGCLFIINEILNKK